MIRDYSIWNEWYINNAYFKKDKDYESDNRIVFTDKERNPAEARLLQMSLSKIFFIEENIKELLLNTKNKEYTRPLPFKALFINSSIKIFNFKIMGILIYPAIDRNTKEKLVGYTIRVINENKFGMFYDSSIQKKAIKLRQMRRDKEGLKKMGLNEKIVIKINKIASNFICNFLDFLNHPEVEVRIAKSVSNNEKRRNLGKAPINDEAVITIKGKLYRYLYETLPNQQKEFSHSFWVKGHYMHFWNTKKYHRLYSSNKEKLIEKGYFIDNKNIICKWKLPTIKGMGILIEKDYRVKK